MQPLRTPPPPPTRVPEQLPGRQRWQSTRLLHATAAAAPVPPSTTLPLPLQLHLSPLRTQPPPPMRVLALQPPATLTTPPTVAPIIGS
ncbi:hypothetical protein E2562_035877 [Oryza meyeriana var. granulata]|uniref:Uncharacterized protein n=1 Tax=Oryza meyeriana var. granulata TaxID=110450 RepID=A0A6G1EST8_9ORYZ|nr:hypothetical protein E2562_035877 [Oryza meyeriana var. granulata]